MEADKSPGPSEMDSNLKGATADGNPPALPIKQRRSHSSSTSSASDLQLEGILNLPSSSPLPSPFADVFAAPTDCNAVQCPIHHHYGSSGPHLERFFSDQTPPPIPKKRLVRTFSLPADTFCRPKQLPRSPHHYENPRFISEEDKKEDKSHCIKPLNFETPDLHLPGFFHSFCHQEQVYAGIQNRYLQFMRSTVKHLEAKVLLEEQEVEQVGALQPQDFVIHEDFQPEKTEQDVFFMVKIPKIPEGSFTAKVNSKDSVPVCPIPLPHHPNFEEAVAHFAPSQSSYQGSAKLHQKPDTVFLFLERGLPVTIVRDFPWGTLEDFVQEGFSLHCSQPDVYERRLCLLMLQLTLGLQHLENHNVKHAQLSPKRIMLVWCHAKNKGLLEKLEAGGDPNGVKKRNRSHINSDPEKGGWERLDRNDILYENRSLKRVHELWAKWATPRIVVIHSSVQAEYSQQVPTNMLQLGALLKHCLHYSMNINQSTQYTPGLLYLMNRLMSENPGLQMYEIAGVLQALLWGPRSGLFVKNQPNTTVLQNWLLVKRSLLVLKLAEKGLSLKQYELDWEDYLCLQYLAFVEPDTILKTTALLGLYNSVSLV